MQDRYTGDLGDFSKLGILRALEMAGLSIGVNWYLTPDENHNGDGRHVKYLSQEEYKACNESLWLELKSIVESNNRKTCYLENENILRANFFSERLNFTGKTKAERESEWNLGTVGYIGTVNTIGNIILSIVAVKSLEKLGVRKTMLISIIACATHMCFYCMVTPGKNTMSLIFMYNAGFLASFSITFGTHASCSTIIAKWFIEKREHLTGIVFSGAGFGAAIWVFLAGQLFRVTDYKGCYRVIIILTLVIGLTAIFLLVKEPEKMGQKPLGWENAKNDANDAEVTELSGIEKSAAMKTPSFWLLASALLCVCSAGSTFMAYSPAWWQANGWSATAASNWDALYLLLSGFVLLFVGKVLAKVKVSVFVIGVCASYVIAAIISSMMNGSPVAMLMILIVLFGALAYPLSASIPGLMGQSLFGAKDAAAISATLMTAVYLGQALYNPIVARFLASDGGFPAAWRFFAGVALLGMILILAAIAMSPMSKKRG